MVVDDSRVGKIKENGLGTIYNKSEAQWVCVYGCTDIRSRPKCCAILMTSALSSVLMMCIG